ncbi:MAG: hypothetical protein KJO98_03085, partial [Rhodothermia bacterium]|nr:hypothetical protein [Rhodothermia bacterium]
MRSRLPVLLMLPLLAWADLAAAQPGPEEAEYYRYWVQTQLEAWDQVARVEFRERSRRTLDNPFGQNTAATVSRVTGFPDEREYERELLSAEFDGRRVPPRRLADFQERWDRFSRQLARASNAFSGWRLRALLATQPSGPPAREEFENQAAYRIDLIPVNRRSNIDRVTLWFAEGSGRILGSRTIFNPEGQRSSLQAELRYDRISGIDVPTHRRIEGTIQTRRRLRHFTTLVTLES